MKKLLLVSLIILFSGCALVDYGNATLEMIDMLAEGTAETYVETQTADINEEEQQDESELGSAMFQESVTSK